MQIKKYRKLPVVIEAMRLPEEGQVDIQSVQNFTGDRTAWAMGDGTIVVISTLEGNMQANPGDYIIKGVNGECYPCKPDIFAKTYEEVND